MVCDALLAASSLSIAWSHDVISFTNILGEALNSLIKLSQTTKQPFDP